MDHLYLIAPLISAVVYAWGAQVMSVAGSRGAAALHTNCLTNAMTAAGFVVLAVPQGMPLLSPAGWVIVALGVVFALGHYATVLSFSRGDVGLATPILSAKVLLVALALALVVGEAVAWQVWVGAVLVGAGITVLQRTGARAGTHAVGFTVTLSLLAAALFAGFDVGVQVVSGQHSFAKTVPHAALVATVVAYLFTFTSKQRWPKRGDRVWPPLLLGSALNAGQAVLLISTIAFSQDVAGVNIVYGSRGIWGVLIAWIAVYGFTRAALRQPGLRLRLIGAGLIFASVVLVFTR